MARMRTKIETVTMTKMTRTILNEEGFVSFSFWQPSFPSSLGEPYLEEVPALCLLNC